MLQAGVCMLLLRGVLAAAAVCVCTRAVLCLPPPLPPVETLLVFDGIKMAATISINSNTIGFAEDQFVR
jgi:hypothetical protein